MSFPPHRKGPKRRRTEAPPAGRPPRSRWHRPEGQPRRRGRPSEGRRAAAARQEGSEPLATFVRACNEGTLALTRVLAPDSWDIAARDEALRAGCRRDSPELVEWAMGHFLGGNSLGVEVLQQACAGRKMRPTVAAWLRLSEFAPIPEEVRARSEGLLTRALLNKNKNGVQHLMGSYGITFEDCVKYHTNISDSIRGEYYYGNRDRIFRGLTESNSLFMLDLLFGGGAEPHLSARCDEARFVARLNGRTATLAWLDAAAARTPGEVALPFPAFRLLRHACATGDMLAAKEHARELTSEQVRVYDNALFRLALVGGHVNVAEWLVGAFQLTAEDARADGGYAEHTLCRWPGRGMDGQVRLRAVEWIVAAFGATEFPAMAATLEEAREEQAFRQLLAEHETEELASAAANKERELSLATEEYYTARTREFARDYDILVKRYASGDAEFEDMISNSRIDSEMARARKIEELTARKTPHEALARVLAAAQKPTD